MKSRLQIFGSYYISRSVFEIFNLAGGILSSGDYVHY
jgi:hypothetical protein